MTYSIRDQYLQNPWGFTDIRLRQTYQAVGDMFVPAFYIVIDYQTYSTAIDILPQAEAMLNAAEGYARISRTDEAMKYLHELGKHVYHEYNADKVHVDNLKLYYGMDDGAKALLQYILFERRVQFLYKGLRWFDIRRYKLDVEHKMADGKTILLSERNPNRNFQIPRAAIVSGMEPNQ